MSTCVVGTTTQALGQMLHATLGQQQNATETATRVQETYKRRIAALEQENRNLARQLQQSQARTHMERAGRENLMLFLTAEADRKQAKYTDLHAQACKGLADMLAQKNSAVYRSYSPARQAMHKRLENAMEEMQAKCVKTYAQKLQDVAEMRAHYQV